MAMATAVQDVAAWLYGLLEPDTTLRTALGGAGRVFDAPMPQFTAANPGPDKYVLMQMQSGLPIVCLGPTRPGELFIWFVRVYGQNLPYSALETAVNRVEHLLWNTEGTQGGYALHCQDDGAYGLQRSADPLEGGPIRRYVGRFWTIHAMAL